MWAQLLAAMVVGVAGAVLLVLIVVHTFRPMFEALGDLQSRRWFSTRMRSFQRRQAARLSMARRIVDRAEGRK